MRKKKNKISGPLFTVIVLFLINVIWVNIMLYFFNFLMTPSEVIKVFNSNLINQITEVELPLKATFFITCILAPFWEELVFRVFPLSLATQLNEDVQRRTLIPIVFFTAIIFGLLHGSVLNILIQGFGGLSLSYLYLKYKSYLWCVISHALWNISILVLTNYFI
jgi:membrane protease YdiL (CAAX protease family)